MDKLTAIQQLRDQDHAILAPEYAATIAAPFGVTPRTESFRGGFHRVIGGREFTGVSAHVLAHLLAEAVGLVEGKDYPERIGIGSQLRGACDAVERQLTA